MGAIAVLEPFKKSIHNYELVDNPEGGADFATLIMLLALGTIVGTFFVGPLMNWLGRRRMMIVGSLVIIVSSLLEVIPKDLLWLQIGRFFVGLGISFVTTSAPTYCVEVAHPVFRGRAGAFYNTGWFVGAIPAAVILYGMAFVETDLAWQLPLLLQAVFSGIVLLGSFFIPESPRWLMSKGRMDEAREFFIKYHADGNEHDPIVDQQINDFLAVNQETKTSSNFLELFKQRDDRYRVFILVCVGFFSQWAGMFSTILL